MRKILAITALLLVVVLVGCGPKVMPAAKEVTFETVEGESEISEYVSDIVTLDSELEDAEAEAELDAIGDVFSDW